MLESCALKCSNSAKREYLRFHGIFKRIKHVNDYDRYPEMQSKWDKALWARGYYVETIGNITEEAVQKYIKEQAEESRKEDSSSTAL